LRERDRRAALAVAPLRDERVRCDSLLDRHFVLARAWKVAQLGSAAVTIAEALVRSPSELLADRCCRR
jgi:hypothetical protein